MAKILLLLALIGAMVYALFWLIEQRRAGRGGSAGGGGRGGRGGRGPAPRRPGQGGAPRVTGPDDDPAFLREIERRRREAQRNTDPRRSDGPGSGSQPPPEPV